MAIHRRIKFVDADFDSTQNAFAVFDPDAADLMAVVVHESAHATIARMRGMSVTQIGFHWGHGIEGFCNIDHEKARLSDYLCMLLSGGVAEVMISGSLPNYVHTDGDRQRIDQAVSAAGWRGQQALVTAKQQAPRLVRTYRGDIIRLAYALRGTIAIAGGPLDELDLLEVDGLAILRLGGVSGATAV